jgi:hypothetical protein
MAFMSAVLIGASRNLMFAAVFGGGGGNFGTEENADKTRAGSPLVLY